MVNLSVNSSLISCRCLDSLFTLSPLVTRRLKSNILQIIMMSWKLNMFRINFTVMWLVFNMALHSGVEGQKKVFGVEAGREIGRRG